MFLEEAPVSRWRARGTQGLAADKRVKGTVVAVHGGA